MIKYITAFLLVVLSTGVFSAKAQPIYQAEDKRLVEEKLQAFSSRDSLPISELITEIGLTFLGTPYVAATLENGLEERLVINLRELDCTTFAENCLALARTVKMGKSDFDSFASQLEKIRYRNGERKLYPSRLHYFSDWIRNNDQKGFISAEINQKGAKTGRAIYFMSTHPNSYPVLKEHPELVPVIAKQEMELTQADLSYFPKENIPNLYQHLQHGDIVGLTSNIEGLDVNHVGIIVQRNNQFYLLHASLSEKKVVVSESPLAEFLKPASKNSGIMIARPVFK
ncbi:MAG: N-acetylmuramoyl-L-alanine amidase-like domain-containing protein [Candidatus Saccharibacteria bacterium]